MNKFSSWLKQVKATNNNNNNLFRIPTSPKCFSVRSCKNYVEYSNNTIQYNAMRCDAMRCDAETANSVERLVVLCERGGTVCAWGYCVRVGVRCACACKTCSSSKSWLRYAFSKRV